MGKEKEQLFQEYMKTEKKGLEKDYKRIAYMKIGYWMSGIVTGVGFIFWHIDIMCNKPYYGYTTSENAWTSVKPKQKFKIFRQEYNCGGNETKIKPFKLHTPLQTYNVEPAEYMTIYSNKTEQISTKFDHSWVISKYTLDKGEFVQILGYMNDKKLKANFMKPYDKTKKIETFCDLYFKRLKSNKFLVVGTITTAVLCMSARYSWHKYKQRKDKYKALGGDMYWYKYDTYPSIML